jgi:ferrochelatase
MDSEAAHPSALTGVLLVNTGTPDAPTKDAVVRYLRRFLSDRRIVNLPPLLWKPILNGIVLKARPRKTVSIYQSIWTDEGSPYTLYSERIERALAQSFANGECGGQPGRSSLLIYMAHRYGNPSIADGLSSFQREEVERLLVLPLYPQHAFATTDSVHDELMRQLTHLQYRPIVDFMVDYHRESSWVNALADSIRPTLNAAPNTHFVFSFHSIPLKDLRHGDAYKQQVEKSVAAIAKELGLSDDRFSLAYQSRFDDVQRWLGPFLLPHIHRLLERSDNPIAIVCPGFAVDCTETLYDIKIALMEKLEQLHPQARERVSYLPCLNDSPAHIDALARIIENRCTNSSQ